jgi:hypothetical protein
MEVYKLNRFWDGQIRFRTINGFPDLAEYNWAMISQLLIGNRSHSSMNELRTPTKKTGEIIALKYKFYA